MMNLINSLVVGKVHFRRSVGDNNLCDNNVRDNY